MPNHQSHTWQIVLQVVFFQKIAFWNYKSTFWNILTAPLRLLREGFNTDSMRLMSLFWIIAPTLIGIRRKFFTNIATFYRVSGIILFILLSGSFPFYGTGEKIFDVIEKGKFTVSFFSISLKK